MKRLISSRANKAVVDKLRAEQQSQQAMISSLSNSIHANELELSKSRQELKDRETLEQRKHADMDESARLSAQAQVRLSRQTVESS